MFFDDLKVTHSKSPIVSTSDYYAFGMQFNNFEKANSVGQKYLYNGKELQDELDLGWLDYGARMYMADIGRWAVVDPLSEAYFDFSAYGYALSNPIRFLDQAGEYVVQATTNSRNRLTVSAHRIPISAAKFQDNLSNLPIIGLAGYAVKALYASTDPSYNMSTADHVFAGMSIVGTGLIKGINSALPRDVSRAGVDILNVGFEAAGMASLAVDNNYSELFLDELTFEAAVGTGIATQGIGAADRSITFTDDYVAEVTEFVQNNSKKELTGKRLNRAVQAEITSRLDKTKNNLRQLGQFFDLSTDEGQADFRFVLDALSKRREEERNKKQDEDEK